MIDGAPQPPAVSVKTVSKRFRLPEQQMHTLKERVLRPVRGSAYKSFSALEDVSFDVQPGEIFGIVGRNGSGKSTLLKCLAGIYRPDQGEIWLRGRMAPFIELGVGFNPDLAARDNVVLNALMLGLTPAEARAVYPRVLEFSELQQFEHLKLKNYSSGMQVRLAFAVMAHVNADLLLIDEVLAVGDAAFQQKCIDTMVRLREEGRTILLVTHDMSAVERFCDRAMLIDRGRMVMLDQPRKVAMRYTELNFERMTTEAEERSEAHSGDGAATISGAWFQNSEGVRTDTLAQGAHCSVHLTIDFHEDVKDPIFGISLIDDQERLAFATTTVWHHHRTGPFKAGEQIELTARFENVFTPGRYFLTPFAAHPGSGDKVMDLREAMISVLVMGTRPSVAVTDIPHEFTIERATSPAPEAFETTT